MDLEETIVISSPSGPMKHQLVKLLLGTIAGFAASKLVEKGYDGAVRCYQLKHNVTK